MLPDKTVSSFAAHLKDRKKLKHSSKILEISTSILLEEPETDGREMSNWLERFLKRKGNFQQARQDGTRRWVKWLDNRHATEKWKNLVYDLVPSEMVALRSFSSTKNLILSSVTNTLYTIAQRHLYYKYFFRCSISAGHLNSRFTLTYVFYVHLKWTLKYLAPAWTDF